MSRGKDSLEYEGIDKKNYISCSPRPSPPSLSSPHSSSSVYVAYTCVPFAALGEQLKAAQRQITATAYETHRMEDELIHLNSQVSNISTGQWISTH